MTKDTNKAVAAWSQAIYDQGWKHAAHVVPSGLHYDARRESGQSATAHMTEAERVVYFQGWMDWVANQLREACRGTTHPFI